jgi:hypothetical protein
MFSAGATGARTPAAGAATAAAGEAATATAAAVTARDGTAAAAEAAPVQTAQATPTTAACPTSPPDDAIPQSGEGSDAESDEEEGDGENYEDASRSKRARGKAPKRTRCGKCAGCLWRAGRGKNDAKCNKCYACAHKRLNRACRLGMCKKINSRFRLTQGILQEQWYNEQEAASDPTGLTQTPVGERRGVHRRSYSDLPELLQKAYCETQAQATSQPPSGRGGARRAVTTPTRAEVPEAERAGGPEAELREALVDGLDRLADRLELNVGLSAVAERLDALVQHAELEHGDGLAAAVKRAGESRDAGVQAELESTRGELASAVARIAALEARLCDRDKSLSTRRGTSPHVWLP